MHLPTATLSGIAIAFDYDMNTQRSEFIPIVASTEVRIGRPQWLLPLGLVASAFCGCSLGQSGSESPSALALRPVASLQELMQTEVDPSADGIWDAVESDVTKAGIEERHPHTSDEWAAVRKANLTLVEATNLLQIPHRLVGIKPFAAEAQGALDSDQIAERIGSNRAAFDGFAQALRDAGLKALAAVDAKDPVALVKAGGTIDEICEGCHLTFWYPNQVIPSLPANKK
jgi:hypothetical protein